MGVLARLLRRSSATSAETASAGTLTSESEAGGDVPADRPEVAEASTVPATSEEAAERTAPPEGLDIPKQQSADEAADSETGEGARQ